MQFYELLLYLFKRQWQKAVMNQVSQSYFSNQKENLLSFLIQHLQKNKEVFSSPLIIVPSVQFKPYLTMKLVNHASKECVMGLSIHTLPEAIEKIVQKDLFNDIDYTYLSYVNAEKKPTTFSQYDHFQSKMKKELFEQKLQFWEENLAKEIPVFDNDIHLFGFSTLEPVFFNFFERVGKSVPVTFYFLSPCMMYWSDICSDRYIDILKKRIDSVDKELFSSYQDLLFDRNPLLANIGKKGRKFAHFLDEKKLIVQEAYAGSSFALHDKDFSECILKDGFEIEQESDPITMLDATKLDLLFMKSNRSEMRQLDPNDDSIQVHSTKTLVHEVETLFESLLHKASALSKNEPLSEGDIVIASLHPKEYKPHFERVFSSSKSPFSYQCIDQNTPRFFSYLLDLPQKRFSKKALLRLIGCAPFMRKHNLEREDVRSIDEIFSKLGFEWGFDAEHRRNLFLLEGYENPTANEKTSYVDFEHALMHELFHTCTVSLTEELFACFESIHTLLKTFSDIQQKECLMSEWVQIFSDLFEISFTFDVNNIEEKQAYEYLQKSISLLRKSQKKNDEKPISFFVGLDIFEKALEEALKKYAPYIQKEVVFCSLQDIQAFQPKILCLLGMNEDIQSTEDVQYQFLQALLLPKDLFFVSYQGFSFDDHQERPPNMCVQELLSYMSSNFTKNVFKQHSLQFKKMKKAQKTFLVHISKEDTPIEWIDVQFLRKAIFSPLSIYFQDSFHLSFPFEKKESIRKLKQESALLQDSEFSEYIQTHVSVFQEEICLHLQEERKKLSHAIEKCQLKKKEQEVVLAFHCKAAVQESEKKLLVPALTFEFEDKKVVLTGEMQPLLDGHLVIGDDFSEKSATYAFVDILIGLCIQEHVPFHGAFFVKDAKVLQPTLQNPYASLKAVVQYALDCKKTPFCLYPGALKAMDTGLDHYLSKLESSIDPYLSLFLERYKSDLSKYFPQWIEKVESVFSEYFLKMSEK